MNNFDGLKGKAILCLDFDGVIHSYTSGWHGARTITDPPVPGSLEFIVEATKEFDVAIYSSRSRYPGARWAMKRWLRKHYIELGMSFMGTYDNESFKNPFHKVIMETAFADPWDCEVEYATRRVLKRIKFPVRKPPAFMQIDDRAMTFTGVFPTVKELVDFKPWNRK